MLAFLSNVLAMPIGNANKFFFFLRRMKNVPGRAGVGVRVDRNIGTDSRQTARRRLESQCSPTRVRGLTALEHENWYPFNAQGAKYVL